MKNIEIMNQLFAVKTLIVKLNSKKIFWENGLTVGLYEILKLITDGEKEIFKIKEYFSESSSSITQKLQKLEKLKLIIKKTQKDDKRKIFFDPTEKGIKAIIRIEKKISFVSGIIFNKYSKEDKNIFMKILKDIEKTLPKNAKKQEFKK